MQRNERGGEVRFSLFVMVREFASKQLQRSGESAVMGQAHATYYLHLAETAIPYLKGTRQNEWLARLALAHDNLRAALRFMLANTLIDQALRFGQVLSRFWLLQGHLSEGLQWLKEILDLQSGTAEQSKIPNMPSNEVKGQKSKIAGVLCAAGDLTMYRGDLRQAMTLCQESLRLYREVDDQLGIAEALHTLAQSAMRAGQFDQALAMQEESLTLNRQLGDQWGTARELVYLGLIHWMRGDYAKARPLAEEGLTRCRTAGDPQRIAQALQVLGWILFAQGELTRGQSLFEESVAICRHARDHAGMGRALPALAWALAQQGQVAQAHNLLGEAWRTLNELGDKYHLASCVSHFSHLSLVLQQPDRAVRLLGAVEKLLGSMGGTWPAFFRSQIEQNLTTLRSQLGEATFAAAWAEGQTLNPEQLPAHFPTLPKPPAAPPVAVQNSYPAGLSEREVEVLRLLAQGLTNAQIAEKLIVSPYTVNAHLRTIYGKLDVTTRAAATKFALEHGLL